MNLRRIHLAACVILALAVAPAWGAAPQGGKEMKDLIPGQWQGVRGSLAKKYGLMLEQYKSFAPGTAGDYRITERRSGLVGTSGQKLPPTDIVVGTGAYSLDGDKLTLHPGALAGPIGKNDVVWMVTKATGETLVLTTPKGGTEEFKKKP